MPHILEMHKEAAEHPKKFSASGARILEQPGPVLKQSNQDPARIAKPKRRHKCLTPGCGAKFATEGELADHVFDAHNKRSLDDLLAHDPALGASVPAAKSAPPAGKKKEKAQQEKKEPKPAFDQSIDDIDALMTTYGLSKAADVATRRASSSDLSYDAAPAAAVVAGDAGDAADRKKKVKVRKAKE